MAEQISGSAGNLDTGLAVPEPVVVNLQPNTAAPIAAPVTSADDVGAIPKPADVATRTIEDVPVTMDDFENAKLGIKPEKPSPTATPLQPTTENKPTTDKADLTKPVAAATKQNLTNVAPRDFSGIPESDVPFFKAMSNEAFAYVKNKFTEFNKRSGEIGETLKARELELNQLKDGKPQLPESYYEHEKAFVLAPEWNEASAQLNLVSAIQDHWSKQLTNIREGKPWNTLQDDGKGGVSINTTPIPADAASEAKIFTNLQHSALQLNKQQQKVLDIEREFSSKVRANTELVSQANKQYFGMFDDPKHEAAPLKKQIVEALPASFKSNPLLPMLVNSLAANVLFRKNIDTITKAQAAEAGKTNRIAQASSNSGPTEGSIAAGTSKGANTQPASLDGDPDLFTKFQERMLN